MLWAGALCTFAIYSILYGENRFYRFFEHIFVGFSTGFAIYFTWSQVLGPIWWNAMVQKGQWWWVFAIVIGSMFYFMYSRKHVWISRVIFGAFMGLAAGGIFREFYEGYFPQIGSSMKAIAGTTATGAPMTIGDSLNVLVFYVILLAAMSYFFFSFEHRHPVVQKTAATGRWFLMIGFGAIFGSTVMGRMTLFIGRLNFLIKDWWPVATGTWSSTAFLVAVTLMAVTLIVVSVLSNRNRKPALPSEEA